MRPFMFLAALIGAIASGTAPRVHEVRMVADDRGYRFEPATVRIARGDSVAFVVVSGQPHSVAFDTAAIGGQSAHLLSARMKEQIAPLSGPLLLSPGQRYTISFADLPSGHYPFFCLPHLTLRMKGEVIVQ